MLNIATVHRFRDSVAVRTGQGETVYLSPAQARKLANALRIAARSCSTEKFTDSNVGTLEIPA